MKKSFCTWYNYLFVLIGLGVTACACLIPYFIINDASSFPAKFINYSFLFAGVVLFGIGFIWQDLYRGYTRHKINDWDNELPKEIKDKAWGIFMPFLLTGVISIIVGAIMCIFIK